MPALSFVDETYDPNITETYYLSIQANLNGLSFSVTDPIAGKYIVLREYNLDNSLPVDDIYDRIADIADKDDFLQEKFKKVNIIWTSRKFTLIPSALFDKDNLRFYFEFHHQLEELDELHYRFIPEIEAYSVFTVPNHVATTFTRKFPNPVFFHQSVPLVRDIFQHHLPGEGDQVVSLNISDDFIDIMITDDETLIFYNTFTCKHPRDILYFVLYMYDQFNLDRKYTPLLVSGNIITRSEFYHLLQAYIGSIKIRKIKEERIYSYTFEKQVLHRFTNLFFLENCEL